MKMRDRWLSAAVLVGAALSVLTGCAGRCVPGDDAPGIACRTLHAREGLVFGMPRADALAMLGEAQVEPPWRNEYGVGPPTANNPFDTKEYESKIGETYEVVRYFVEIYGNPACPFIQGRLVLEPLIFIEDQLVGWEWPYLEESVGKRLGEEARIYAFGSFCGSQRAPQPATSDVAPGAGTGAAPDTSSGAGTTAD